MLLSPHFHCLQCSVYSFTIMHLTKSLSKLIFIFCYFYKKPLYFKWLCVMHIALYVVCVCVCVLHGQTGQSKMLGTFFYAVALSLHSVTLTL